MATPLQLDELDAVEITVIVDNEVDPISRYTNKGVTVGGRFFDYAINSKFPAEGRGDAKVEMRMENLCCGVHGLSYLITAVRGEERRSVLFDAGPEEWAWEMNAKRTGADIAKVEVVQLSHWHKDHSGGILRAIKLIREAKAANPTAPQHLLADLHPSRPAYRGMLPPDQPPISLEPDATFSEIASAGATVVRSSSAHTILDGAFIVSGEIPRVTPYENGSRYIAAYDAGTGEWRPDELIMDERLLMCRVRGKGVVVFTGCSHAGVVNVARHARELATAATSTTITTTNTTKEGSGAGGELGEEEEVPLFALMGGYHMIDSDDEKVARTVRDIKALGPPALMIAGHCSGWRVKAEIERQMEGCLCPSTVGTTFRI